MSSFPSLVLRFMGLICTALLFSGCASYGGSNLKPGESTLSDVIAIMGEPTMRWRESDGREQLAYPRGPYGTQTFMVFTDNNERLVRIEKVLNMEHFARIEIGKSDQASVLKLLGPVTSPWNVVYFKARDELVWSWLFCDSFNQRTYFDALFDGTTGIVRTTQQRLNFGGWNSVALGCGQ